MLMMSFVANAVEEITPNQLEKLIDKSSVPVVVDIYADWCGYCKVLAPMLEKSEKKFAGKVKIVKINVEKHPDLKKNVQSLPTIVYFKKSGDKVKMRVQRGAYSEQKDLDDSIKELIDLK